MNAGNKGVEKKHEDDHAKDGQTLHQQNLVSYSVLWEENILCLNGGETVLSYN